MKNIYLIFTFLIIQNVIFSQNTTDKIINDLNSNFKLYGADYKSKIYLNRNENIIDIENYLIPLNSTEIIFESENRINNGIKIVAYVTFRCESNSISDGVNYLYSVSFAFKSKDGAYKFLDLIYKLKSELKIE